MRLRLMTALLLVVFTLSPAISLAETPVPQINYQQLSEHPFETHGLKIAIQHFNARLFRMNLTNTTTSFVTFAPEDMALVDKTGNQLFLYTYVLEGPTTTALPRLRIA